MIGDLVDIFFKYKYIIGIIILCIFFLAIALYQYYNVIKPKINPKYNDNSEFIPTQDNEPQENKVATIYFFFTTWCPYCKQAKPAWDSFKEKIHNTVISNTSFKFEEIDCDKNTELADKYKVEGYPTIKLITQDGTVYDYDAKPDVNTLTTFVHEVLN